MDGLGSQDCRSNEWSGLAAHWATHLHKQFMNDGGCLIMINDVNIYNRELTLGKTFAEMKRQLEQAGEVRRALENHAFLMVSHHCLQEHWSRETVLEGLY